MTRPLLAVLIVAVGTLGCAARGGFSTRAEPLRVSEVTSDDPRRSASLRLCLDGLDADAAGRRGAAVSQYERAIQLDPTNPYAYLVLARYAAEMGEAVRALEYLDRAESLLSSEGGLSPRVEPHLAGLRGVSLDAQGLDGDAYLERAERLSPSVWADGRLSASELR